MINKSIRDVKNNKKLVEMYENNKKKFYIYSKSSFLKYYNDFDINFYKNTYFSEAILPDIDILLYYHNKGKFNNQLINDKIKIIIYTPIFSIKCGGIVVMHNLAKQINDLNNPKIYAKIFNPKNIKYKNIFCNDFAKLDEINNNTYVIYPEIIFNNPLNSPNVIRWILLDLGIEMPLNHYKNWDKKDLIYFWESHKDKTKYYKQLSCPWINPIFKKTNYNERKKTCYLFKKAALFHSNIINMHPKDSICIEELTIDENVSLDYIANLFNECKYLYCYDPNSAYALFAAICGCIPIIYPIKNMSKEEYLSNRIYNCDRIIDIGIAYGNTEIELKNAAINISNIDYNILSMINYYNLSVKNFLKDLDTEHMCQTNIIDNYYNIYNHTIINDYNMSFVYNININDSSIFDEYSNYFINNNILLYDNYYILENHKKYFYWIKDCLKNNKISIKSPYTNNIIYTDLYFIISIDTTMKYPYTICNYYFIEEDIVIGLGLGTGTGPMETHILYIINFKNKHFYYNWAKDINNFIDNILQNILFNKNKLLNFNKDELKYSNISIYGYHNNLGHNLFNDISGLYILDQYNIPKYIDKIIMGSHDVFYINKYFTKYQNINIDTSIKLLECLNNTIGKGIVFKYNHFFLSNKCIDFLKNHLNTYFNILPSISNEVNYIKKNFYPIIHIVLRIGSDEMINQDTVISDTINKLLLLYPNSYFILDGFLSSSNININDYIGIYPNIKTYNDIIKEYIDLVNSIEKMINTTNYKSLINLESYNIIKYLSIITYSILQVSSISCVSDWICNKPGIQFGRKSIKIYEKIDKNIKEDGPKIEYIYDNVEYFDNKYAISSDTIINLLPQF